MMITSRRYRRSIVLLIFSLLLFAFIFASKIVSVSSRPVRPALSKKKVVFTRSKAVRIKVKGARKRVRWAIRGKKLVKIKARGKRRQILTIKPKKTSGSCWLLARVGKKKLKCKIILKIPAKKTETPEEPMEPVAGEDPAYEESDFSRAMTGSAIRLLQKTVDPAKKVNLLLSPDSVITAVSMAQNGSGTGTREEMEHAWEGIRTEDMTSALADLHKELGSSKDISYQSANSIWYREGLMSLKPGYMDTIGQFYHSDIYPASFDSETVNQMNNWVSKATQGKIPSIADRLSAQMQIVLLNAVYFKGEWMEPFDDPYKDTFIKADGTSGKVNMHRSSETNFISLKGGKGFCKPYKGGKTAFLALLPPEKMTAEDYVLSISGEDYRKAYKDRKRTHVLVKTKVPEFSCEYQTSLKDTLIGMGIKKAFSDQADFTSMSDKAVFIDDVVHKTYIKLDKNGTEAAAVTAVIMKSSAALDPRIEVKEVYLNRPFVYGIIDTKTGIPLFLGICNNI